MLSCHGNGNLAGQGCCWVEGVICRHRLTAATLTSFIDSLGLPTGKRATALTIGQQVLQGTTYACGIAAKVLIADPSLINNRAQFDAAWDNHPDYLAYPRPQWAAVEARCGFPVGSYKCSSWGPAVGQCCFGETQAENDSKMAALNTTQVILRRARSG